ncbi:hypothetical protein M501DRAFT_926849 [Patellaria atrata CBS 101060]|uniref:Zn(2)-C6 fungal-type domain-containing protein n=1 Tax=Patellaria atrata CBS 101060 TaxID=1346257 RepID=A0A9P4SKY7_9PEZI|nr:hypothetical protein M501DRAFT_926849 [Patellaria atrata CBS 101060]
MFTGGTDARPQPFGHPPQQTQIARPSRNLASQIFPHSFRAASTSPSITSGSLQDQHASQDPSFNSQTGISPTHISSSNLSAQKRAYRQRRKDPSCDACRERKVKCDATETSSCSECSSRNVKCQFTKETNRRMSSIKQVQDLQSQLTDARQEIHHLRNLLRARKTPNDLVSSGDPNLNLLNMRPPTQTKRKASRQTEFEHVREGIRTCGIGIFNVPPAHQQKERQTRNQALFPLPSVPSRAVVKFLLGKFHDSSLHSMAPIVDWDVLHLEIESVYAKGSFQGLTQSWVALFFALLACGTLQRIEQSSNNPNQGIDGQDFIDISGRLLSMWIDDFTLDDARAALLISIYLTETNSKSAGWFWLGSAVRIAQVVELDHDDIVWSREELDLRRRVWWSIYTWDRILSLERGRPILIPIDDSEVNFSHFPNFVDGVSGGKPLDFGLPAAIPTMRFVSQIKAAMKFDRIPEETLHLYDNHFHAISTGLPDLSQPSVDQPIDPQILPLLLTLQLVKLHFYRHNLSISCATSARLNAIHRCRIVALDTVHLLSRTMRDFRQTNSSLIIDTPEFRTVVAPASSSFLCTHLWRCLLFLTFCAEYSAALTCIKFCSAVGELRKVNMACGRNISFFLDHLVGRVRAGVGSKEHLEQDEEILAYLSGDMQGDTNFSWIWPESPDMLASPMDRTDIEMRENSNPVDGRSFAPRRPTGYSPDNESRDWGDWRRVERQLHELMDEQRRQGPRQQHFQPQAMPVVPASMGQVNTASTNTGTGGSSRISIANII